MSNSPSNRRQSPRTKVSYRLDVWDESDGFLGCVSDLSETGARVMILEGATIDQVKGLRLDLPRWLALGESIELKGRFVWSKTNQGSGAMEAGFSFEGVQSKRLKKLELLLDRLCSATSCG